MHQVSTVSNPESHWHKEFHVKHPDDWCLTKKAKAHCAPVRNYIVNFVGMHRQDLHVIQAK